MANMTESAKRYRLQVPAADESVQKWLAAQINISNSLRLLIREDIQKNGFTDVTCRAVEQGPKRGRPTNAELERRAEMEEAEVVEPAVADTPAKVSNVSNVPSYAEPVKPNVPQHTENHDAAMAALESLL